MAWNSSSNSAAGSCACCTWPACDRSDPSSIPIDHAGFRHHRRVSPSSLMPTDPRRIGPYTLLGRLGAGGMGVVYLGDDAGGVSAAVKVMQPGVDAELRDRM